MPKNFMAEENFPVMYCHSKKTMQQPRKRLRKPTAPDLKQRNLSVSNVNDLFTSCHTYYI